MLQLLRLLPRKHAASTVAAMRILMFGTFDGLHPGHRFIIGEAFKRASADDRSTVRIVVARDRNVKQLKGRHAQNTEEGRADTIRHAYPDAEVVLGSETDFFEPIRAYEPDLILLGYDQTLPHGIDETDIPCAIQRLPAFMPEKYKSSLLRGKHGV